ncbi:hypothetical protein ACFJGV_11190 [Cnuibacter sp. UC19_7]|uniref:hypothetical protein n=1 Tax=Cnuibacter sp. UC19_7 TaxID=3350166 RepID=UPI00366ECD8C
MTRQAIAKHFSVLAEAGLVESVPSGRELRFRAVGERLSVATDRLDAIGTQWDARFAEIKRIAESR